jgi:cysteine desulfurase
MEKAREELAELLGCRAAQVVFNSGATEGANAVFAYWAGALPSGRKVAVNPTEHPCVVEAARHYLAAERLVWLEIDPHGVVRLDRLETLLADKTVAAVSVMAANNETGVLQPWREVAMLCRRHRVAYHCDASQWLGKLPASGVTASMQIVGASLLAMPKQDSPAPRQARGPEPVERASRLLHWSPDGTLGHDRERDLLHSHGLGAAGWVTASAHKFGGPKGTGFLLWPAQAEAFRSQRGGEQENGHRAGTEDHPAIAAMVAALTAAESTQVMLAAERLRWRNAFVAQIRGTLPGVRIVGAGADRLWNTVSLIMPDAENHRWVTKLDKRGFQVSTGSACATGKEGPSPVLAAMGFSPEEARRVIRVSAGWETAEEDWHGLAAALAAVEAEIEGSRGIPGPPGS